MPDPDELWAFGKQPPGEGPQNIPNPTQVGMRGNKPVKNKWADMPFPRQTDSGWLKQICVVTVPTD